jgi:nitrogen fixation NifU-like protein
MPEFGWYTEKVIDHYQNPRNMGELDDPDGVGVVGNPTCGDMMQIQIRVEDDRIEEVKFKTFGCGAAIATTSVATELIKGKTIEEALQVTNRDVMEVLGSLPPVKVHCSLLAEQAIKAAVDDYRGKSAAGEPDLDESEGARLSDSRHFEIEREVKL